MRSLTKLIFMLLAVCLVGIGCKNANINNANTGGTSGGNEGGEGSGNQFTVTVSSGVNPTYSWNGGSAFSVSVVRTSAQTTIVWNVTDPLNNNIESPVTHGTVPAGALETFSVEKTLTAGVEYRVSVVLPDKSFGFTDFTP